jgi:hypothetical protein
MKQLCKLFALVALLGAGVAALLLAGCGGGGNNGLPGAPATGRGVVRFTIQWPEPQASRLIPVAAQSIKIVGKASSGGRTVVEKVVPRPPAGQNTTTVNLPNLPAGATIFTATAYPTADATGTPQATGSVTVTVVAGQTVNAPTLTMGTTIVKVQIDVPNVALTPGQSTQVTASALDAQNNVVLTSGSTFAWQVQELSGVSVTSNTNPTTVTAAGNAGADSGTLVVTENESGRASAPVPVTITVPAGGANSTIFIADSGNKRIVGLDDISGANFTVYSGFASSASGENPQDVDLDQQGRLYIAAYPRAIVRVDNLNGTGKVEYVPDSPPGKVWVDAAGRIYWRDDLLRINRIDDISGANRVFFGGAASGLFQAPAGIVTDSANRIYVIDTARNSITRFDDMTGANPKTYGSQGSGVGQFKFTFGVSARPIAIDNANRIYVADTENRRVVRLDAAAFDDPAAANWTVLDIPADASGNVFRPLSVAVDEAASPHIYLSGYYYNGVSLATINYAIVRVDDISGANLQRFGTKGSGSGQFDSPVALVVK